MRRIIMMQCLLVFEVLLFAASCRALGSLSAEQASGRHIERITGPVVLMNKAARPSLAEPYDQNNDISYYRTGNEQEDSIFNDALQKLDAIRSLPSCHRLAASKLVSSCKSMEAGAQSSAGYEALDRVRSVFGARLAICELEGGGASIPPACLPLMAPPPQPKATRYLFLNKAKLEPKQDVHIDDYPKELLMPCLMALESRPQSWISYSNSRQNAMVICQAARMEKEKEDLLNLHRSIVDTSAALNNGLQGELAKATERSQANHEFAAAVSELQQSVLEYMQDLKSFFQEFHDGAQQILSDTRADIKSTSSQYTEALENAHEKTVDLNKGIENASSEMATLRNGIKIAQEAEAARSIEVARVQKESGLSIQRFASSLQTAVGTAMDPLFKAIAEKTAERIAGMDRLGERLDGMERAVDIITLKAEEASRQQEQQIELLATSVKFAKELQLTMQVIGSMVEQIFTMAANVSTMMESIAKKAQNVSVFTWDSPYTWFSLALTAVALGKQKSILATSLISMLLGHKLVIALLQRLV